MDWRGRGGDIGTTSLGGQRAMTACRWRELVTVTPGDLGDGALGAGAIDQGLAIGGGGDQGGRGGVPRAG